MAGKRSKQKRRDNQWNIFKGDTISRNIVSIIPRYAHLRSISIFTLSCISLYAVINALPPSFTKPFNEHTAQTLGLMLNCFGIPALTSNDIVSEKDLAFQIIPECTPIFTVGLFVSFVAFHPASMRQKATGLVWGITALYLGNIVRLFATFFVSRYDRRLFEVSHVYLGQIFTLFLVILCCVLWMRWVERREAKREGAADMALFLGRFGLISAGLFFVWVEVHHGYIWFLDWLMAIGFSLFGRSAGLARTTPVYYETFSIVIVISLILAAKSITWQRRIQLLGVGVSIVFLIHLFHRINNALMVLSGITLLQKMDLTSMVIGQYLVPVLLLIYIVRHRRKEVIKVAA